MKRLTQAEIQDRLYPVLMRYSPAALKTVSRDKLICELAAALDQCDVLAFNIPGRMHGSTDCTPSEIAASRRAASNAAALEAAARAAVLAILAVVEVRLR